MTDGGHFVFGPEKGVPLNLEGLILHYYEEFESKPEALKRERFFKSVTGNIWLKEQGII